MNRSRPVRLHELDSEEITRCATSRLAAGPARLSLPWPVLAAEFPRFVAQEIDPHVGNVCYAVTVADVDGDGKLDVVAVSEDAVVWYREPDLGAARHHPRRDRDGQRLHPAPRHRRRRPGRLRARGRLAAARHRQGQHAAVAGPGLRAEAGRVHPIAFEEPALHRLRWGDVKGTGKKQLVVAPFQGRGTKGPELGRRAGRSGSWSTTCPADPAQDHWPVEVADESLHTIHNLQLVDFDGDGRDEIVLAAWEGVFLLDRSRGGKWTRTQLGAGNQESTPFKGASEVKVGRLASGSPYIATIEPWHGFQVVVYTPRRSRAAASGTARSSPSRCSGAMPSGASNLDGDADDELDHRPARPESRERPPARAGRASSSSTRSRGIRHPAFDRHTIDDGGMACEDVLAADLDGDGRNDIIAGGRATHNVKIYWNRAN